MLNNQIDITFIAVHHHFMRTTLTLDDDVLKAASKRAESLHISLGKAVSDLARRGLEFFVPIEKVNGLAVFTPPKGAPRITMKKVREALSDFP
ncbi:MAG: antitoxin [Acidobacteria bacterium]|nr:antitoxin [Acidobacteriota bacterium]MCI0722412.1 antitoxin [Acidobacteriota bacterium]